MAERFSKIGFVLSIIGAAIGLGNAWKFPYMVGSNGGSAFILIYLFFAFAVGLSIFFAEMAMGKISRLDTVGAFKSLATKRGKFLEICRCYHGDWAIYRFVLHAHHWLGFKIRHFKLWRAT